MNQLSLRLVRTALFASFTSLVVSYAVPALAQIPIAYPDPEPGSLAPAEPPAEPAAPPDSASAPPTSADAPASAAPSALAPPVPAPATPQLPVSRTPPAKAEIITTRPAPSAAADDDDDDDAHVRLGPRRHWYGWQTLTVDGISLAMLSISASLRDQGNDGASNGAAWAGALGYEFGPSIVHFVHHNPGRGFASMGLRLGLPLAGAFIGASVAGDCTGDNCQAGGVALGTLFGIGGAIAIDAAVFAYDDPKPSSARAPSFTPLVSVSRSQAWVGFGGHL